MKARIINDVEEKANLIEFDGETLDLQAGMYSYARIEDKFEGGFDAAMRNLDKIDTLSFILATLINEANIVRDHNEGTHHNPVTGDYVLARMRNAEQIKMYFAAIETALGLSTGEASEEEAEKAKAEAELDELLGVDENDIKN